MNKINTALCAFGMSGRVFHAPFLATNPGFNFYGVYERTKNLAAEKYPHVRTFRNLDDLLEDQNIELVIVNSPNFTHFDFARRALLAGKHVVVEKPFTVTVAEAEELIRISEEKNLILSVYQNRRFDGDFLTCKKILDENLVGEVVEMEMNFARFKETPGPKLHKVLPGPGAGIFYDLGSHLIDQAVQLFGLPEAVFGDIRMVGAQSKVDDTFEVLLFYPDLRVRLKASHVARESAPGYIIQGRKGSFLKKGINLQEEELSKGVLPNIPGWGREPESEMGLLHAEINGEVVKKYIVSEQGNYNDYYTKLYRAIREGSPVPVPAEEGLDVIRIIQAAFESSEKGCKINLS